MQVPRFFLDVAMAEGVEIALDGSVGHQISRVLRLTPGRKVVVHDGQGVAWQAELKQVRPGHAIAAIGALVPCAPEPRIAVTLFAAVLKGDRQDLLIQKAVELGVARIQPIQAARCVARLDDGRVDRWQRIAREAAQQCERGVVPPVSGPIGLRRATWTEGGAIVCTERGGDPLLSVLPDEDGPIALFVGPEGGWEPFEVDWLGDCGVRPASLGPRILRSETAAIAALAAIMAARVWSN